MSIAVEHAITEDAIHRALSKVQDPEIHRPITELDMVKQVNVAADGTVQVAIFLTVAGCPMKDRLTNDIKREVGTIAGVTAVEVELDVMSAEQRETLKTKLRGGQVDREIPFAQAGSLTRVYAIASGKGGVGKSSVTVNLAAALAAKGLKVTPIDDMILAPTAPSGVKVISIGMFTPGNSPVVWRGPMLHRAIQQFLADVYWGDLDVLLLDLPPGTGDIAISVAQLVPNAEILVVTTPQQAAAEVAERAGTIAVQTRQRITGVIENMSWMPCPHCGEQVDVFGSGGGQTVAEALSRATGTTVPVLGQIPIDVRLREGGDSGEPITATDPESPAAKVLLGIADKIATRSRGLVGMSLSVSPVRK
ncbi:MAG: P-loop NTPase [Catenulisporales bacterium]|nr:P-loop NTPase [Catenulisporales bacterium]